MTNQLDLRLLELEKSKNLKLFKLKPATLGDASTGKVPQKGGWQDSSQWLTAGQAVLELETLDINFGIACGAEFVVVDVDCANGKLGFESLRVLELELGVLPKTWTVVTGSGGLHFYFKQRTDQIVKGRIGVKPGIDIKANGGYLVAPGSLHYSGEIYQWKHSPESVELVELPQGWIEWLSTSNGRHVVELKKPRKESLPSDDGWRGFEFNGGLCDCPHFPNNRVPKPVVTFFELTVQDWKPGNPNNPPWSTPLWGAAKDCERAGVPMEEFVAVLCSVAPLGCLTESDMCQIRRGYQAGKKKPQFIDMQQSIAEVLNEK